jgi:hypothetical protein
MILSLIGFVDPAAGVSTVATFAAGLKRGDPQAISVGFALLADNAGGPAAAKDLAAREKATTSRSQNGSLGNRLHRRISRSGGSRPGWKSSHH